jgi:RNA polymerase sigma factor (sigma-70 family)
MEKRLVSQRSIMNNPRFTIFPSRQAASSGGYTSASAGTTVNDEALFLQNLPIIDAAIGQVCRRHHLTAAEAEDFASDVRLHIIERNYEPLRKFQGRSTLRTYLVVVIQHLFLDYRNRVWGRWRPTVEAKRQGPIAILVERLIVRDGRALDEVIETLRTHYGVEMDERLQTLCIRLAKRAPARQFVGELEAGAVESAGPLPDANVLRREHDFRAKRVQTALDRVKQALLAEERLILKMHFEDGVSVADIARVLDVNQKKLYRRLEKLLARLREGLEAEGISRAETEALFSDGAFGDVEPLDADVHGTAGAPAPAERVRTPWQR